MIVYEGDLYWYDFGTPRGSAPGYRRPVVVVQADAFNTSALATVIVCVVTGNLKLADLPGNVTLRAGEGGLTSASVVNVSQVFTIDKSHLDEYIGRVTARQLRAIRLGLRLMIGDEDAIDLLP